MSCEVFFFARIVKWYKPSSQGLKAERSSQIESGPRERKEIDQVKFFLDPRIAKEDEHPDMKTLVKIG